MCKGCEYFKTIAEEMPDELMPSEVICLASHILDAYLSGLPHEDKVEVCRAIALGYLERPVTLHTLN